MEWLTNWLTSIPPKKRYTLFGFFFGLIFPLAGTLMEVMLSSISLHPKNFWRVQLGNPILLIVDTAPLVLALIFRAIGKREEVLEGIQRALEERVAQRTRELRKTNAALAAENEEKKIAEKEILRQKNYLQALIENSPTAIVLLDTEQKILHCNPAFENLYGYNCKEIKGQDIDKLVATEETLQEARELTQIVATERFEKISKRKRKDGSLVDVEIFGVPIFIENERAGALIIYHDISTLVKARQAAEEANRAKSEFLANMSHEIRTPMNGVIGMLDIALETDLKPEQKEYLTIAIQSAESLLQLLNDILDYSKIEAKKLELETIEFDLRNTVEGVAYTLAHRAQEKGLELASLIPANMPTNLLGDPSRLRQILTNLTGNAIKFTEKGEVILRVETVKEDEKNISIRFSVEDTGIGIREDRLDVIFERFTQADGSTTRKFGGTGLGLAISQHLVEAMGGEMFVKSEYGNGSTFGFTLPFQKQTEAASETDKKVTDLAGLNILIIDDNETNRLILLKMLKEFGAKATAVESGQAGLDALLINRHTKADLYDIVLLDMQMPDMDGEQTARAIFSDPRNKHLSVVVLTSMGKRGDAKRLEKLGCAGYLLKPIKQKMLSEALLAVINEKTNKIPGTGRLVTRHLLKEKKQEKERILLAEDNLVNQKVAVALLQKQGYSVDVVDNGKDAVERIKNHAYSVVLMDVQMPTLDGLEATRRIRAWEGGDRHIPIIAMTAHAMKGDRERCLQAGMDDYISKPIDKRSLFIAIERWGQGESSLADDADRPRPKLDEGKKSEAPVNIIEALPRFGNDHRFFNEMSEDFIQKLPKQVSALKTALASQDMKLIGQISHNIKGVSSTFSAERLSKLSANLETVCTSGDPKQIEHLIAEIEEEAALVIRFLKENKAVAL